MVNGGKEVENWGQQAEEEGDQEEKGRGR